MTEYTLEDFMDKVVLSETRQILQTHPYHAVAIITVGIEIIGKCFCKGNYSNSGPSEDCFYAAIQKCSELAKYQYFNITKTIKKRRCLFAWKQQKKTNELYAGLRCGMLHSLMPNGFKLVPDKHDFANREIGCIELYNDVAGAWQSIKMKQTTVKKDLTEKVYKVEGVASGATFN